jgi:hypothetical protein
VVVALSTGQAICEYCLDWHASALEFLGSGLTPRGCQECGATWEALRDRDPLNLAVRMYVVPKDGIYQLLCDTCVLPYTAKRADLYRGTPYWTALKAA